MEGLDGMVWNDGSRQQRNGVLKLRGQIMGRVVQPSHFDVRPGWTKDRTWREHCRPDLLTTWLLLLLLLLFEESSIFQSAIR